MIWVYGILIGVLWFASGFIPSVGWHYAYFKRKYPDVHDEAEDFSSAMQFGLLCGVIGPIGTFFTFFLTHGAKYGWTIR